MEIKLKLPFARNSAVDEYDVVQMKKALNRLGYYFPYEKVGITSMADHGVFEALKNFQKDHHLPATGTAKPEDETVKALNKEASKTPDGQYIWRTVEDGKVRAAHAQYNRKIRAWSDSPDPGEDYNCRCWAEPLDARDIPIVNLSKDRIRSIVNNIPTRFEIEEGASSGDEAPWYKDIYTAQKVLKKYTSIIDLMAKKHNLDPDLIRAVMWAENARGSYWGAGYVLDEMKASETIMPMNINKDIWYKLVSDDSNDLYSPVQNIEAATILLKRIQDRIVNPTPEKIAAIWHFIGHEKTNNYSAYVGRVYKEKPWIAE
jgi:peptidoglycan hydrolase-like protein with peptidoglycan-binding domain